MIYNIPLTKWSTNYQQIVNLNGTDYVLEITWNQRNDHWYFSLKDIDKNTVLGKTKIVADIPFLAHKVLPEFSGVELWCITDDSVDPSLNTFSDKALLSVVDGDNLDQ